MSETKHANQSGQSSHLETHTESAHNPRVKAAARALARMAHEENATDVQGSYTGVPLDGGEPVQDADDL